jgi:predicted nucleic acid-binding protein
MKAGIAVADAGPLHYFALLGHFDLLGQIFDEIIVPAAVRRELLHQNTPPAVRGCINKQYSWLTFHLELTDSPHLPAHAGELEAIQIAKTLQAKTVLMDDSYARQLADNDGLIVIGTIGLLEMASAMKLIDLEDAFRRLQETNAFVSQKIITEALDRDKQRKK